MIEKKIVFITGAGASFDFGFPTGEALITELLNLKFVDITNNKLGINLEEDFFEDFQLKLQYSNTPSIDIFIANNPKYIELSKTLIAKILATAEQQSMKKLFKNSWLKYLWIKMVEGCKNIHDFMKNNIKFITFNYDRVIEYFFAISVSSFFNFQTNDTDICYNKLFEVIPIIHVFGKIGNTEWENETKSRTYDALPGDYKTWKSVGQELKTMYESKESTNQTNITKTLNKADEIYFLGFGYNTFNLELLGINQNSKDKYISGTRYGMSNAEVEDINNLNNNIFSRLSLYSVSNCYDFLKEELVYFARSKRMYR